MRLHGRAILVGALPALSACAALLSSHPYRDDASDASDADAGATTNEATGVTPPLACGGVDLASDPANCGACGHDCRGGLCAGSRCVPVQLAGGITNVRDLALDDTNVFAAVSDSHAATIVRVPKSGGAPTNVIADLGETSRLVVAGDALYAVSFGTGWGVVRIPKIGGASTLVVDAGWVPELRIEGDRLWVVDHDHGKVGSCALQTCPDGVSWLWEGDVHPWGLVLTPETALWTAAADFTSGAGRLRACDRTTCLAPKSLATGMTNPSALNGGAAGIFWVADGPAEDGTSARAVWHCATASCEATKAVVSGKATLGVFMLRTDARAAFWADDLRGDLWTCDLPDCAGGPRLLVADRPGLGAIAMDDAWVYFAAFDGLWRVPR